MRHAPSLNQMRSEIALLRQHVRELQAWKDGMSAFLSAQMGAEDKEAWEMAIRKAMVE